MCLLSTDSAVDAELALSLLALLRFAVLPHLACRHAWPQACLWANREIQCSLLGGARDWALNVPMLQLAVASCRLHWRPGAAYDRGPCSEFTTIRE